MFLCLGSWDVAVAYLGVEVRALLTVTNYCGGGSAVECQSFVSFKAASVLEMLSRDTVSYFRMLAL